MMHAVKRHLAGTVIALGLVAASLGCAAAQDYPTRPIRIVVPYTTGGAVDVLARTLGQRLTEAWGQQVVVDNRPGAGGSLGTEVVAKSPSDGYTLLMSTSTPLTTNLTLYKSLRYDTMRDFDAVAVLGESSVFVVGNTSMSYKTIADVIAAAKEKPGALSIGSAGYGTLGHFLTTRLNSIAGVNITHVPYRGGVPAVIAVMTGEIPLAIVDSVAALPFMSDGRVRGVATSGSRRSSGSPLTLTLSESGLPNVSMTVWIGCVAPKGTPPEIMRKLNAEIQRALKDPQFRETLTRLGLEPVENLGLGAFTEFLGQEIPRWRRIVLDSGLKME